MLIFAAGFVTPVLLVLGQPLVYLAAIPGVALAFAIFRGPRLGLYLTAAALPLDVAGNVVSLSTTFNISLAWVFTLLTAASWLMQLLLYRKAPVWPKETTVLVLYLLLGLASLPTALEFDRAVEEIVRVVQTIVFFWMIINLVETRVHLRTTLIMIVSVTILTFAYALAQRYLLPHNVIEERGLDWLRPGAVTFGVEMGKVDTYGLETVQRATGTTVHSGVLALNCAYFLPFIALFLRVNHSLLGQIAGWTSIGLLFGAFSTTLSRSGFLTLALTLALLVLTGILRLSLLRIAGTAILIVVGLVFLPDGYINRVLSPSSYLATNSDSLNGRLELWAASLQAILDNPLTGFGIGNEHGIFDYWRPELRDQLGTVMNTFLQVALEIGILGMVCIVVLIVMLFGRVLDGRRASAIVADQPFVLLGSAFLVLLVSLIASWMTVEFMRGGFKNVWLLLACIVAYARIANSQMSDVHLNPR